MFMHERENKKEGGASHPLFLMSFNNPSLSASSAISIIKSGGNFTIVVLRLYFFALAFLNYFCHHPISLFK